VRIFPPRKISKDTLLTPSGRHTARHFTLTAALPMLAQFPQQYTLHARTPVCRGQVTPTAIISLGLCSSHLCERLDVPGQTGMDLKGVAVVYPVAHTSVGCQVKVNCIPVPGHCSTHACGHLIQVILQVSPPIFCSRARHCVITVRVACTLPAPLRMARPSCERYLGTLPTQQMPSPGVSAFRSGLLTNTPGML
jgi:hypothetical protein